MSCLFAPCRLSCGIVAFDTNVSFSVLSWLSEPPRRCYLRFLNGLPTCFWRRQWNSTERSLTSNASGVMRSPWLSIAGCEASPVWASQQKIDASGMFHPYGHKVRHFGATISFRLALVSLEIFFRGQTWSLLCLWVLRPSKRSMHFCPQYMNRPADRKLKFEGGNYRIRGWRGVK